MINKTCMKCLTLIEASGDKRMNFCLYCGSRFDIDAKGEQPFHLPESEPDVQGMIEKSIKDIDLLLGEGHPYPLDLVQALTESRELLRDIQKSNLSNRDETKSMLEKMKDEREKEDWDWDADFKNIHKF